MGILRWAQRHLFPFHKTCRVILPFPGASGSIWHDRPEPLRAHLTHSHINWIRSSRNRYNNPTPYKPCRERQIWNCKAKHARVEIWCVLKPMRRRTVMCAPQIIRLNQLRFVWKMLVYGAILTASWLRPIYRCLECLVPSRTLRWEVGPCIRDLREQSGWPFGACTLQVWEVQQWEGMWTEHMRQGKDTHPLQTHSFHSPQYNLPCLLPRTTFFFSLSHSVWGLIHWIETDKMDLEKSGGSSFYKCQIKSSSSFYYTKPITPPARRVRG